MSPAPLPEREAARLAALHAQALLDSPAERGFDELTQLAARLFAAPIALVSLVDRERQWFKARVGLEACETSRDSAFCAWAILRPDEVMVVSDALHDPRFACNPLVLGPPSIRFYAGAALVDRAGHALGTLCVIDTKAREFSAAERNSLAQLARQVVSQIELRASCRELGRSNQALLVAEAAAQARNERLVMLQRLGALLLSGAKSSQVLAQAMELTREFAGAETVALLMPEPDAGGARSLGVVATSGTRPALLEWLPACTDWLRAEEPHGLRERHAEQSSWFALDCSQVAPRSGTLALACGPGRSLSALELETLSDLALRLGIFHEWACEERQNALDAARLRESERRFRDLSDNSPVMIWMGDASGACIFVNQSWLAFSGRTLEQELGGGWLERVLLEDRERLESTFRTAFQARAAFECEFRIPRHDGAVRWVLTSGHPRWSKDDEFEGYLGSCLDITERVLNEQSVRSARDDAIESARLKSQFLANMSHEIRTPLNGVIGMLELLLAGNLEGEQYHMVQVARSSGEALLHLLNDILDLAKMESGKLALERISFDPRELADHVVQLFEAQARTKGLELELEFSDDVPGGLLGDPARLRQVLANLVGNAVKFTSSGRVVLRVEAKVFELADPTLEFAVQDTGPGLPGDAQDWIFQNFSQGDASTTRRFGGSGLGLAIARQLVELMGGRLQAESRPGEGARFYFGLPLEVALEAPRSALPTRTGIHRAFVDGEGLRVLVAEDNPVNREVITRMLRLRRYELELAEDGEAAVAAAQRAHFDLILMDVHMPRLDGCAAATRIRANELARGAERTPILALTASAQPEDHRRCMDAGMDACLTKPIRMLDLDAALRSWVARKPAH